MFGTASVDIQGCWLGQRCGSGVFVTDRASASMAHTAVALCGGAGVRCSGASCVTARGCCVVLTRKAGVRCEKSASATLIDCTLLRNAHGGANVVDTAHIIMRECRQLPPPRPFLLPPLEHLVSATHPASNLAASGWPTPAAAACGAG